MLIHIISRIKSNNSSAADCGSKKGERWVEWAGHWRDRPLDNEHMFNNFDLKKT